MGEKGVGKLSRETPPPREGEPMGADNDDGDDNYGYMKENNDEKTTVINSCNND